MVVAADTFGTYGRRGSCLASLRAARAFDHLVTWAIALVLLLFGGIAGYGLWDSWKVTEGTDLTQYRPGGPGFAELLQMNPDVVAWIKVDGTSIDYPVVQGEDNFEYLDKDATGASSASGSIFLDSECGRSFSEPYEVLFGHHMALHKMFGDIDLFLDEGFFDQNTTATLYLPQETLDLEVCAVLSENAYSRTLFATPAGQDRVAEVRLLAEQGAVHYRTGSISDSDQLIALSTCSSEATDQRTILICKVANRYGSDNANQ